MATTAIVAVLAVVQGAQAATIVDTLGGSTWTANEVAGGTAAIVDLSGVGGNLENNAPLGTGAVKLTTGASNADKAEINLVGNFGTIADFLAGGSLSYSFFKQGAGDLNASAAAAIKFTVLDTSISTPGTTDGYATFIYEPTWNQAVPGSPSTVPTDDWYTVLISGVSGIFWHTGIYGATNMGGGPGKTLSAWDATFLGDLASATITAITIGVGTYNQGQTAFVDDVSFKSGSTDLAFNFEAPAAVPVPAALPLMLAGLGALGAVGMRRKRLSAQR